MKKNIIIILVVVIALFSIGCSAKDSELPAIKVSSKAWTEQLTLGSMTLQYLEAKGYEVEDRTGLGETPMLRPAIQSGEIDLYWEYTGTTLMVNMKSDVVTDSKECYEMVKKWDAETNNITWLDPANANNTYILMVREDFAKEKNLATVSELADYIKAGNEIRLGAGIEFVERPDGIKGLETLYDFKFDRDLLSSMAIGITYEALKNGQVDVAMGFGTDGRIISMNFNVLEDNLKFFPVYNPAPIVRSEILEQYPDLESDLNKLPALLTGEVLQELNRRVDVDGLEPEEAAEEFLRANGLID
ncbi:glycine betaine ABC transporter substrate-binding protein [Clostridiaceae bacterium HSG29]|nr:glycine betaine ABC transporter substrate-binding protein [Clostridiaceae bacterium HSG29]